HNYAKGGRRRNVCAGVAELSRVEGVEKLGAEFDVGAFTQRLKRRTLNEGDVEIPLVRPEDHANAAVTETRGAPVISNYQPGGGIGCRKWGAEIGARDAVLVEIIVHLAGDRAGGRQVFV